MSWGYNNRIMETIKHLNPGTLPYNLIVSLAISGYTVTGMRKQMLSRGYDLSPIPDVAIIRIVRAHRKDVEDIRTGLDKDMDLLYGLSNLLVRVRRLCTIAEVVEPLAQRDDKWASVYRQYLAQIRTEMEPFGIQVSLDDGWAELLDRVIKAGQGDGDTLPQGAGDSNEV